MPTAMIFGSNRHPASKPSALLRRVDREHPEVSPLAP
jgi:hypothetical protein